MFKSPNQTLPSNRPGIEPFSVTNFTKAWWFSLATQEHVQALNLISLDTRTRSDASKIIKTWTFFYPNKVLVLGSFEAKGSFEESFTETVQQSSIYNGSFSLNTRSLHVCLFL